jgi:hypothetical protein
VIVGEKNSRCVVAEDGFPLDADATGHFLQARKEHVDSTALLLVLSAKSGSGSTSDGCTPSLFQVSYHISRTGLHRNSSTTSAVQEARQVAMQIESAASSHAVEGESSRTMRMRALQPSLTYVIAHSQQATTTNR